VSLTTNAGAAPARHVRLLIAAGVALVAAAIAAFKLHVNGPGFVAGDFTTFWMGGRAMLDHQSPYAVINRQGDFPFDGGFYYPLPAAITVIPFAWLGVRTAMPLFAGVTAGILAYAFTRDGYWRLPLLMSFPMLWCVSNGQWAPLIVAAAILPSWGWAASIKPTLGFVAFAHRLSFRLVVLAGLFLVVTVIIWPWWPREWLAEVSQRQAGNYRIPVLHPLGFVLLLALARWRRPEARVLLAMAIAPQTVLFYDQLPLALVAQTFRQALIFGIVSYVPYVAAALILGAGDHSYARVFPVTSALLLAIYYLPALVLVLRRPNVGEVPEWAEQTIGRAMAWASRAVGRDKGAKIRSSKA